MVRPHAGAAARRDRPGRCRQAPAVDRLDPHRARPGRAHSRLHQMGRPAGLAGGGARSADARLVSLPCRPDGAGLRQSRRRDAGGEARRAVAPDRRGAFHAAGRERARRRARGEGRRAAEGREEHRDADRPRVAQRNRMACARETRRGDRRARHHRPESRRELPDRSPAASRRALGAHPGCRRAGGARPGRPDPQPRLGRSRRHLESREGAGRERQGRQRHGRLPDPQWLEHGPSGPRAGRRAARRRSRTCGAAADRLRSAARRSGRSLPRRRPKPSSAPARSRSSISRARCATRSATSPARSRICRCRGTARGGRSAIRSTSSAPTAAAGLRPVRA